VAPRREAVRKLPPPLPAAGGCQPQPDQLHARKRGAERHRAQGGEEAGEQEREAD